MIEGSLQEVSDALTYLKWDWSVRHQWTNGITQLLSDQYSWSTYTAYQLKLLRYAYSRFLFTTLRFDSIMLEFIILG